MWSGAARSGVSLRLQVGDARLPALLERLRTVGVEPFLRLDREYSAEELDAAQWLILRVATAGLYGGMDYGQGYRFENGCATCRAGAESMPPLVAELSGMDAKDVDHLVHEGHLVVSQRLAAAFQQAGVTGVEPTPVPSRRRPPAERHVGLRITSEWPRLHATTTGYSTQALFPQCGRGGHHGLANQPEMPRHSPVPAGTPDMTRTWEHFGDWRQVRSPSHTRPVGGRQGIVVSQRARRVLLELGVRRLVWTPMSPA